MSACWAAVGVMPVATTFRDATAMIAAELHGCTKQLQDADADRLTTGREVLGVARGQSNHSGSQLDEQANNQFENRR